jgi:hypothetical protein
MDEWGMGRGYPWEEAIILGTSCDYFIG